MQSVVDRLRKEGQVIEDGWLRRMGPVHFSHVNFRALSAFLWSATRTRSYNYSGRRRVGLRESEGTRSPCTQIAGRAKVESAADFQISSSDVRRLS